MAPITELLPGEKEAVRLLGIYTAGRYTPMDLAGPSRASVRTHILGALTGARVPQSKAGVGRLREELLRLSGVDYDSCMAVTEDKFIVWCKEVNTTPAR